MPPSPLRPVSAILIAALLASCGGEDKKPASQVVAKVNKGEISIHQVNSLLARAGNVPPEQAKQAGRQVLDKLVEQELLVQKAVELKLDREPKVMQAVEAARRDIVARAYLDKVAAGQAKPGADEIRDFYAGHPELFKARRVYQFNELAIQAVQPDLLGRLQQRMGSVKSLPDLTAWLRSEKIPFSANASTKAAEQLPLDLLPRLHQMKDGQIAFIPGRDVVLVVQLAASREMPLEESAAAPYIESYLGNQRRLEATEKEVRQLREQARIEYLGEFAEGKPAVPPKAAAAAAPDAAKPALGAHMDKGIAGLK